MPRRHPTVQTTLPRTALALVLALLAVAAPAAAGPSGEDTHGQPRHGARWCDADDWGEPRQVPARLERVADRARQLAEADYEVRRARATAAGVVALVTGDVRKARRELRGVRYVASWGGDFRSDFPPGMRIGVFIQDRLTTPVLHDALRRVRGVPGRVGAAFWDADVAVVLEWKAPVPARVQRLAVVRPNGVEVRVVPRPYSGRELQQATNRLIRFLDERDVDWSTAGPCSSAAGVSVGVPGPRDEMGVSQAELEEAAGMRVLVEEHSYVHPG